MVFVVLVIYLGLGAWCNVHSEEPPASDSGKVVKDGRIVEVKVDEDVKKFLDRIEAKTYEYIGYDDSYYYRYELVEYSEKEKSATLKVIRCKRTEISREAMEKALKEGFPVQAPVFHILNEWKKGKSIKEGIPKKDEEPVKPKR